MFDRARGALVSGTENEKGYYKKRASKPPVHLLV